MAMFDPFPAIERPSECVLLLRFGDQIEQACNDRVHAVVRALRTPLIPGLLELVPAYATLAVHYDPVVGANFENAVIARLSSIHDRATPIEPRLVEVPVCYNEEFGLDLAETASALGLCIEELVARHTAGNYRVAMLGFAPGFPYLLGLDSSLHLPRRSQPRLHVPAGSVAIGGAQTGIYPSELPGGWHLIGRTPLRLFDTSRDPPQRLDPGDFVRFIAIDRARFDALATVRP